VTVLRGMGRTRRNTRGSIIGGGGGGDIESNRELWLLHVNFTIRTLIQRRGNSIPFNLFICTTPFTVLKERIIKQIR
jgi:hypothetical protein